MVSREAWVKTENPPVGLQQARAIFSPTSNFGWWADVEKSLAVPAVRLEQTDVSKMHVWVQPYRLADPRGARRRLKEKTVDALAHFIAHDMNGKVMGIDGVLEYWRDSEGGAQTGMANAIEDMRMIRASMDPLRKLTNTLSWLYKEHAEQVRAFSFQEIYETFSDGLPRLFKPIHSFRLEKPVIKDPMSASLMSTPYLLAFWLFAICHLLSALKKSEDSLSLSFGTTADHHGLILNFAFPPLTALLENEENAPEIFWDGLMLLAHQGASWKQADQSVELTIPLKGFRSAPVILGFGAAQDFDASVKVVSDLSPESIVAAVTEHLFDLQGIIIGQSVENAPRAFLTDLASSVRELPCVAPSRSVVL